jgi:hypothetical protein
MRALQALLEYSDGRVDGPKVSGTLRECQDAIQEAETLFFDGARPIIGVDLA